MEFPPEKLIEKVGGVEDKNERRSIATEGLQNPGIDVLTPSSTVSSHYENAPVMSIFTNSGVSVNPVSNQYFANIVSLNEKSLQMFRTTYIASIVSSTRKLLPTTQCCNISRKSVDYELRWRLCYRHKKS